LAGIGDIRHIGSGNIGTTNVLRTGSKALAAVTLVCDIGKGVAAVLIGAVWGTEAALVASVAVILGHMFPVWLRFRGGKGVATALGVFLALAPTVALGTLGVFVVLVAITRIVSLASIIAAVALPIFALLLLPDRSPVYIGGVVFIASLVILKHHANIKRLMAGTEARFGSSKSIPAHAEQHEKKAEA
jgi:glycerol-3-phosphate acyltransferase PlsY